MKGIVEANKKGFILEGVTIQVPPWSKKYALYADAKFCENALVKDVCVIRLSWKDWIVSLFTGLKLKVLG